MKIIQIAFYAAAVFILLSNCGQDNNDRIINKASILYITPEHIEARLTRLEKSDRDFYMFTFEGYKVSWNGKIVNLLGQAGANKILILVRNENAPDTDIYLIVKQEVAANLHVDEELEFEGIIDTFDYEEGFKISIYPVRIITEPF